MARGLRFPEAIANCFSGEDGVTPSQELEAGTAHSRLSQEFEIVPSYCAQPHRPLFANAADRMED